MGSDRTSAAHVTPAKETPDDNGQFSHLVSANNELGMRDGDTEHHVRVNTGLLAGPEKRTLLWLAARTPAAVSPDQLTVLGIVGAFFVMIGFICCQISAWFGGLVVVGLALNWLGDSLDGTLARYRHIERPDFGYLLDHSCDLISQTFIFVGLGFSPYFTIFSGLVALSMYLLMTSFTYLKVMVLRTHHLSYYGVGATELRLMIAVWMVIGLCVGPGLTGASYLRWPIIDIVIGVMGCLVFVAFMWKVYTDVRLFRNILD